MSPEEKSQIISKCIKNLYKKGKYVVEYAILQTEKYSSEGKLTAVDYDELYSYFLSEMTKSEKNTAESAESEENSKEIENISGNEEIQEENSEEIYIDPLDM